MTENRLIKENLTEIPSVRRGCEGKKEKICAEEVEAKCGGGAPCEEYRPRAKKARG